MTSGAIRPENKPIKMCLTGDSGAGKSGAIVSLLLDEYKIRDIDVDNGLDIVLNCLHDPNSPYYALAQKLDLDKAFRYETVNHKMITIDDGKQKRIRMQPQSAIVWPRIQNLVHEWRETNGPNLGPITNWKDDTILVLDSSTFTGYATFAYVQEMNNHLGEVSGNSWRRDIGAAQQYFEDLFRFLYSDAVKCHVIVITHINYLSESYQESEGGTRVKTVASSASDVFGSDRAYPTAIGRALGPRIGRYFNNVLEMKTEGSGRNIRRIISTVPTQGSIGVKTSAPFSVKPSYDVSTGLAEIFRTLRGEEPPRELMNALQKPKLTPNLITAKG